MPDTGSLMECNKEEATRCKEISEAHFKRHDLVGAKKYALKARQLFPDLEGLPQLFSILDVHIAAHFKLRSGDSNCYGILQVDFRADDNTIRKQYRKLALVLHPDKNKAFGAEAAFKHISEAWSVLSDRDKKLGFDKKLREHMAARFTHLSHGAFQNQSKSSNVNQGQTHVYSQQGAHVHRQQGQFHTRVQQQGHGQYHAHQQQWHGHAYTFSQHRQGQASFPQPHGQGQAIGSQQQRQGQTHGSTLQGQGPAHVPQQQVRDQARDQQGQNQGNALQQQWQGEPSIQQEQGQRQPHYEQQEQCQVHVEHRHGQGPVHAHPQQGQGTMQAQGQAHQAPVPQKHHGPEHQVQGQVPVHEQVQGPAHTHQQVHAHQQGQGQAIGSQQRVQGQAQPPQQQVRDQPHVPEQRGQSQGYLHQGDLSVHLGQGQRQPHVNQQQAQCQVHVQDQQGQGPVHSHPHQGQGTMQAQGQDHQAQKYHAFEHQVQGPVHVHQQGQGPAHAHQQVNAHQQGQGPAHVHQQQGQYQTQAQGQAHQARVSQNNQAQVNTPSQPAFQHSKSTFWTACPSCRMQLEYERVHMNKNLCCPMCYKAFVSKEIAPVQGPVIWPPPISQSKPDVKTDSGIKSGLFDSNFHSIPGSDSTSPAMVHPNKKAKIGTEDSLLRQHGHQKPQEAPAQPAQKPVDLQQKRLGRLEKDKLRKKVALFTKEGLERLIARSKGVIAQKLAEEREKKAAADMVPAVGKNKKADNQRSAPASDPLIQNKPVAAGKEGYVHKTEEKANGADACNSRISICNSTKLHKESRVLQEGSGCSKVEALQRKRKLVCPLDKSSMDQNEGVLNLSKEFECYEGTKDREVSDECSLQVDDVDGSVDKCKMEVPDPDFHNFDGDRTEGHFVSGHIWASYDDDDGMPRYYSRVNKILSRRPLKMQMNWLEACSPSDETLAWLNAGFQHSCGDFILGSTYIAEEVSTFSHLMAVDKGPKGGFKIYPRRGDVWAVYREWEILKVKDDKRGYDMVEIVAAFVEGKGIQVSPLFKVTGFKTIFERKTGEDHVKWIPPQELRRLSHQVPAHRIVAGEVPGIQVDCLELDPASTPMDLIYGKQKV